jgi:protein-L-isoaspartate(D-aspartate) O-methyltransferase
MSGWIIPPPIEPQKAEKDFLSERETKVKWLQRQGYLKSARIKKALLKVPREGFIPDQYRDYAYMEVPFPLPGKRATISCPHSYPLFYEPLGLTKGDSFLEVGAGSGYGAAVAREVVGSTGLVVSLEIDEWTYLFAKRNLEKLGYHDVCLVLADGALGEPQWAPYDCISITAACEEFPAPLIEQLNIGGRMISPIIETGRQTLVMLEKSSTAESRTRICEVLYVLLQGQYGTGD